MMNLSHLSRGGDYVVVRDTVLNSKFALRGSPLGGMSLTIFPEIFPTRLTFGRNAVKLYFPKCSPTGDSIDNAAAPNT